jgi:hypothetical protein
MKRLRPGPQPLQVTDATINRDPKKATVKRLGFAFVQSGGGGRATFEASPYAFDDIIKAYNTDCYVRQALDKYIELMFKSGWNFIGSNEAAVEYVRQRLRLIAEQTKTPTDQFLIEVAEDLIKFANVFIIKARAKPGQGIQVPGIKITPLPGQLPIAGYFVLPVTTITIARDINGNVANYQQTVSGSSKPLTIKPEDMVHVYYKKEHGYAFGNPFVGPVLDDIRLLREVEENVARLIYRHLNPLYLYTVGVAQPGMEAKDSEIEAIKAEIENMPTDGGLVVPERHKVEVVGANGEALDANDYLRYYEQRVFTGLGLPETVMGRGDTANRGTSDNLSAEARDRIKAFQKVMEIFINNFIISELLLEGGFDPLANPDDVVSFKFEEIDIDNKIKFESHAIQLWTNNLITHDEARQMIGNDTLGGDLSEMFTTLVTQKEAEIVAALKPSTDGTADNKARPANQHGKKTGPKKSNGGKNPTTKSNDEENTTIEQDFDASLSNRLIDESNAALFARRLRINTYSKHLERHYTAVREDVVDLVKKFYSDAESGRHIRDFDPKRVELLIKLTKESLTKEISEFMETAVINGISQCQKDCGVTRNPIESIDPLLARVSEGCEKDIDRLLNDVQSLVISTVKSSSNSDAIVRVRASFDVMEYRLGCMARSQSMRAFNYAYAMAAKALGREEADIIHEPDTKCSECLNKANDALRLKGDLYRLVPPWHTNCWCHLKAE